MRRLIWAPILHTQADMGSAGQSLGALYSQKFGQGEWERHIKSIDDAWEGIRDRIGRLGLNYGTLRLYQDGLPNCGQEMEIVRDLAEGGSRNHQLLMELVREGAALTGTESPELLLEEYRLAQKTLKSLQAGGADNPGEALSERRKALLRERDRYVGRRIGETLRPGETGLIFLGLLHSIREHLPEDMELVTLERASRESDGGVDGARGGQGAGDRTGRGL